MKLPQLLMESKPALISIKTTLADIQQEQPAAVQTIRQKPAEMYIQTSPSKLSIDQTEAWASVDLKSNARRMEDFSNRGKSQLLEGMARRVREGNDLMRIENGGNPIKSHAKKNSVRPEKQFGLGFVPPHFSVKLNYTPSELEIDWNVNQVEHEVEIHKPILNYAAGSVTIDLRQQNSLDIRVSDEV